MRAIVQRHTGNPDVLKLGEIPSPVPSPTQVLVDVKATALNRADTLQRRGFYPPPEGESKTLGLELAGVVTQVGDQVEGVAVRDRIFGLIGSGGYAEQAVIDYRLAMPIPEGWTFEQAAAVTEVFFTANETLFTRGQLTDGETVLIHAGGSGVGSAGIQLAHQASATVLVTAGSEQKIERTKTLGATAGINYKTHDFAEQIRQLTDNQGVDIVQDFIGADYLSRNLEVLKFKGRLIVVGLLSGAKAEIDLGLILRERLQILGFVMRRLPVEEKARIRNRFVERWFDHLVSGQIQPIIDTVFPLEAAGEAHKYMEANQNFGKIILQVSE